MASNDHTGREFIHVGDLDIPPSITSPSKDVPSGLGRQDGNTAAQGQDMLSNKTNTSVEQRRPVISAVDKPQSNNDGTNLKIDVGRSDHALDRLTGM